VYPSRYSLGFPLLIAPVFFVLGPSYTNAIVTVFLMNLGSIALVYLIARRLVGLVGALVAAGVVVLSPLDQSLGQRILSDEPASFIVMCAFALLLVLADHSGETSNSQPPLSLRALLGYALVGGLLGFACWVRQIDLIYLPVPFAANLWTRTRTDLPTGRGLARSIAAISCVFGSWAVIQIPILWYNAKTFGSITKTGYSYWVPYWYSSPTTTFSLTYAFNEAGSVPSANGIPTSRVTTYLLALLGANVPYDLGGSITAYSPLVAGLAIVGLFALAYPFARNSIKSPQALRQIGFVLASGTAIVLTFVAYSLYFFYSPRFLDLAVLLIAIFAGGGANLLVGWLRRAADRNSRARALASIGSVTIVALLFIWQAIPEIVGTSWWQTSVVHRQLNLSPDYDLVTWFASQTADNAYLIADLSLTYFGAEEAGTKRRLVPLTDAGELPPGFTIPTLKDQPEQVLALLDDGHPVYYFGQADTFTQLAGDLPIHLRPLDALRDPFGQTRGELYRISRPIISVLSVFHQADVVPPRGNAPAVGIRTVTLGDVSHSAILAHPDSIVTFPALHVPQRAWLSFAVGIDPSCPSPSAGAHFEVAAITNAEKTAIFSRDVQPTVGSPAAGWQDEWINLQRWGGQDVKLELTTSAINGDYRCAWALWGDPAIET
jgi:4-amino-4-deoxy-L-arabinose transferase-like glycosyltransferase